MKKKLSILFIFMLLFQTVSSSLLSPSQADAEGPEESIFTGISYTDEDGNDVNIDELENETAVNVHYDWSVAHVDVEEVNTDSLLLPEELHITEEQQDALTYTDEEPEVGTYQAFQDGVVTIDLNEAIVEHPEAEGSFVVEAFVVGENQTNQFDEIESEESSQTKEMSDENEETVEEPEEDVLIEKGKREIGESLFSNSKSKTNQVDEEEKTETSTYSEVKPFKELSSIFTFEFLKIDDKEIQDGDIIEITEGTQADLEFSWDTEGMEAEAGDTAQIQLSDAFKMVTTPEQDILVEGTKVGTYQVENGVLKFEFDEGIETSAVQNGFVNLGLEFNLEKFKENIEQEIPFNDGHENNITVIARPNIDHSGIEKEGHPDAQQDAREIRWTIDVVNTDDEEITEATLADTIPDGLGDAKDFVIHELSLGYDGDITEGADVTSTLNPSEFPIDLGTVAPFNGYRVQYTTTIENYAKTSFTNEATFEYGETSIPAKGTVGGLERSNPIEKNGWQDGDSDVIQWQIDVNKNGSIINDAIVKDTLPDGLTINNIEVVKITQNGDHWSEGDPQEGSFTEFPIKLGALGQDDAYRIKFQTSVNWGDVNSGEYLEDNGFDNNATLFDGDDELNDDQATVNIVRDPILEKVEAGNVDYENRTVTWEVTVNKAKHPLTDVTVTDYLPEGLSLSEDDVEITGDEGTDFSGVKPSIDTTNDGVNDGKTKLSINLTDVGTETITINYTTSIEDFTFNHFTNTVGMTGDGVGEGGEEREATIVPNANTYTKNVDGIDYSKKTIAWRLNVNPVKEDINDGFVITDTYTNDGLILLPDTVDIKLGEEGLVNGTDYTVHPIDGGYKNGFTITFDREIADGELVVNYTTSYDPQKEVEDEVLIPHSNDEEEELYRNKAEFDGETENGMTIDEEDDASQGVREDSWNSGKKEGQLIHVDENGDKKVGWESGSERKIAWQLYTNYQEQNLGDKVSISDTLAYEGEIDQDSIQVSVYDVNAQGETTITDTVLGSDKYSVTVDGKELTIDFNNEVEVTERYVVEFTTSVPNISAENYMNNATVTVDDKKYDYEASLHYKEYDDFLDKGTVGLDGNEVFTGDEVEWEVTVNESLSTIQNAVITDTISAGHVYKEGSLQVFRSQDRENALEEGADYEFNVEAVTDDLDEPTGATNVVIDMTEDLKDTLVLQYTTVVTETDGQIGNSISLNGSSIEKQEITSDRLSAREFSSVGGEWASNRGALSLEKVDAETGETITNEATFTLWYELNGDRVQYTQAGAFTTVDGVLEVGNLPLRTYYLVEETAPTGYVLSEGKIEMVVDTAYDDKEENIVSNIFANTKEKIDITGTKEWQGGENQRPESIELQLYRDGKEHGDPVSLAAGETEHTWEHTWADLDKTDIDGKAYEYTVDEVQVPENFEKSTSEDGLTVTNTFVSPTTEIPVEKVWEDTSNQDGNRPASIEVELLANGNETNTENITLSNNNEWNDSFTDLPVFDNSGSEITYTVKEVNVPDEYKNDITGDATNGFVITNSYTPSTIDIPVEKIWEDGDNQDGIRPNSITVNLLADGESTDRAIVLNESNNWGSSFTNLDEYQSGDKIEYTIEEANIPAHYDSATSGSAEDGYTITNSYTPEVTDIEVEKVWEDDNDRDGVRPETITIHLYDDQSVVVANEEITADEDGNWTHTFEDLPKYCDGEEIKYSVTEDTVADYSTSISDNHDGTFTVTNEHTPEQTSVTVNKLWEDENDQDGKRPDSIRVQLLADGNPVGEEVLVTASDNWTYTWSELDANRDGGEAIDYTVEEVNVPVGYESEINDENHGAISITNSREPELIDIPVEKEWDDADNQDGNRPDSITLHVVNGTSKIVATAEVTTDENGEWIHEFEDLPKYQDGNEIAYRVIEDAIEGYSTTSEKQADGFVITNSYTPENKSMTVVKGWEDGNNQDGVRPDHVTVQLFADEQPINNPVRLSEDNDWTYTWKELDVNQNGEPISYTVEETEVPEGYGEPTVQETNGNVLITNNRTPDTVDIPVTKVWNDAEDQDGVRPDNVTVNVINDLSEIVDTVELNEENDWTHTFENLPENRNQGEEISYRVTEDTVEGYSTELETNDQGEVTITNAYTPEQTSVTVTKGWQDNDNQDGIRTEQVEVQLYAGEDEVGNPVTLSEENDWMHTWSELDAYQNGGEEINYTVKEVSVPEGYEVTVNDEDHGNIILTNHHEPEQTSVHVSKVWEDANNQDGIRSESITVNLLAGDEKIDSIELDESNNWQADFTELDTFKNGELIDYTVEEVPVDGYETETTGNAADGYVITNTHEPELIDLAGTKTWDDADNQDGKRPDIITVNLLANGEQILSVEVTEEDDWSYAFTDLPKYEAGNEIEYTVSEDAVENYETTIDGYDITNTLIPEEEEVTAPASTDSDKGNKGQTVPDTATNLYNTLLIGLALLAIGITIMIIYRKRKAA